MDVPNHSRKGGLDVLSLILERGIKPIPTLSLPLKGRELRLPDVSLEGEETLFFK